MKFPTLKLKRPGGAATHTGAGRVAVGERASSVVAMIPEKEFRARIKAHGIYGERTVTALHLVLVKGFGMAQAARLADIHQAAVTRALARLRRPTCDACGQALPDPK